MNKLEQDPTGCLLKRTKSGLLIAKKPRYIWQGLVPKVLYLKYKKIGHEQVLE
ncbi:hypothetical protein [Urinicoccus massiliensis]|uniref:hypothetical protein n=1 Tax=Urinicoccus massiliensis TaxID=1723382 RepID=UPI000B26D73C|nr:hypothetical protein [Urinicoccus massiliensis]